jgi:quinol monooxygenase YgiN
MLIVISSGQVAPGHRDEFVAAARTITAAARQNAGCQSYGFYVDLEDSDRIVGVEIWQDQTSLDHHMQHSHTKEFLGTISGLVTGEPTMAFYEVPEGHTR